MGVVTPAFVQVNSDALPPLVVHASAAKRHANQHKPAMTINSPMTAPTIIGSTTWDAMGRVDLMAPS